MLETGPVMVRFFKDGSVDEVEVEERSTDLEAAKRLVLQRYPEAVFDRCCQHEPDGGCVFCYANELELEADKLALKWDDSRCRNPIGGPGRWVGIIASVEDYL